MDIRGYLASLGIGFREFRHPPVYTCEEANKYNKEIRGIHSKNLFLKERKGRRFYLVILPEHKRASMEELGKIVDEKLKFANDDDLISILGVHAGSVSPFALINDKEHRVKVMIDREVWDSEYVSFHPCINTETFELLGKDFHRYIESLDNDRRVLDREFSLEV